MIQRLLRHRERDKEKESYVSVIGRELWRGKEKGKEKERWMLYQKRSKGEARLDREVQIVRRRCTMVLNGTECLKKGRRCYSLFKTC